MIDSADIQGVTTTTTLTFTRGDVTVTVAGVPATIRWEGQPYVDGPLAERIDDAARALLDAIVPWRDAGGKSDGNKGRAPL